MAGTTERTVFSLSIPVRVSSSEVNGRRFLCIASMGFDSEANRLANETRHVRGNLVYAYAALRALAAWKPATFTIVLDGEEEASSPSLVPAIEKYRDKLSADKTAAPRYGHQHQIPPATLSLLATALPAIIRDITSRYLSAVTLRENLSMT